MVTASSSGDNSMSLTTEIAQHRLHTGLGISGGGRGSLTKCVSLISNLILLHESQEDHSMVSDDNNNEDGILLFESMKDHVIREIKLQEIELLKLSYIVERNQKELDELKKEEEQQQQQKEIEMNMMDIDTITTSNELISTTTNHNTNDSTIKQLRNELQLYEQIQVCYQEYEGLCKIIRKRHPISQRIINEQITSINNQISHINEQLHIALSTEHIRQSQFHLLQHCIQDIKQSFNEPLFISTITTTMKEEQQQQEQNDEEAEETTTTTALQEVHQQQLNNNNKDDDTDDALYGDL